MVDHLADFFTCTGIAFGKVVVEQRHDWQCSIAARFLKPCHVVHEVSVSRLIGRGFLVEGVVLLVQTIVDILPTSIFVFVGTVVDVVDDHHLGLAEHLLACRDIERAVDDLAEHVDPNVFESRKHCPLVGHVSVGGTGVFLCVKAFGGDGLRSVPNGTTIDAGLFHHGGYTRAKRVLQIVVVGTCHDVLVKFPSAAVVAHAVVIGQTGYERSPGGTL